MTDKQKELERLHDIVFEGAPEFANQAFRDKDGLWMLMCLTKPYADNLTGLWSFCAETIQMCKNQPDTFLDWTDTLIRRKQ